jgi:hypothetical protein
VNLRIAPEYLRFRIAADEFAILLTTGTLQSHTQCSDTVRWDYAIHTNPATASAEDRTLELATSAVVTGLRFDLTVFADGIVRLQSGQTGKDGLREHQALANGDLLSIGLEIDLHSKKDAATS